MRACERRPRGLDAAGTLQQAAPTSRPTAGAESRSGRWQVKRRAPRRARRACARARGPRARTSRAGRSRARPRTRASAPRQSSRDSSARPARDGRPSAAPCRLGVGVGSGGRGAGVLAGVSRGLGLLRRAARGRRRFARSRRQGPGVVADAAGAVDGEERRGRGPGGRRRLGPARQPDGGADRERHESARARAAEPREASRASGAAHLPRRLAARRQRRRVARPAAAAAVAPPGGPERRRARELVGDRLELVAHRDRRAGTPPGRGREQRRRPGPAAARAARPSGRAHARRLRRTVVEPRRLPASSSKQQHAERVEVVRGQRRLARALLAGSCWRASRRRAATIAVLVRVRQRGDAEVREMARDPRRRAARSRA